MPAPKMAPQTQTRTCIDLPSLVVAEGTPILGPKPARPVLPTRVAIVGNYLPRQCGIATFTTDLCEALSAECAETQLFAVPVNDTEAGYNYPARVRFELSEGDASSYHQAAAFLNDSSIDVVCLQHEYGIFGGRAGGHILQLLRNLHMPFVTTLHTVLRQPSADQHMVMQEIAARSARLIVMSQHSAQILHEVSGVPDSKIDLIPHGVPDLPFVEPHLYKQRFGTADKAVLLTFGLLSANKGIENVIQALPRILSRHSDVIYVVAGATHPHVKRHDGEKYRESLQALAKDLGVQDSVIFDDRFVDAQELVALIDAADIYITPYKHQAQVVSGTLAYALSAGKAIISTPYLHAIELLDQERGVLVPFDDPGAIAARTIELLDNDAERDAMRKRAYLFARDMIWSNTARRYMKSFQRARNLRVALSARAGEKC
jgi:glycosyltransferase involved in cell wall biosynthesis